MGMNGESSTHGRLKSASMRAGGTFHSLSLIVLIFASVAQVFESDFSGCRMFVYIVVCVVSAHVLMSYPGLAEHLGCVDVATLRLDRIV